MGNWSWLAAVAAFVGAGLSYVGAYRGTQQKERQGRREEWGRRFTSALDELSSPDARSRRIGRIVLAELAASELATEEEKQLAGRLLREQSLVDPASGDIRLRVVTRSLDDSDFVVDHESPRPDGTEGDPS